ncbi:MAG: hypothetical protein ABFS09_05915 [Thermodesulfobacteriota bacterium]
MGCCQKFLNEHPTDRPVLCLKWVLALRLIVLASLVAHLLIYLLLVTDRNALLVFLIIIHFVIALSLLQECTRSVDFHRNLPD